MERGREQQPPQPPPPPPFEFQILNQLQLILQRQDQIGNLLAQQGNRIHEMQNQMNQITNQLGNVQQFNWWAQGAINLLLPQEAIAPPEVVNVIANGNQNGNGNDPANGAIGGHGEMMQPQPQVENGNGPEQFVQQVPIGGNENPDVPVAREIPEIPEGARPARALNIPVLRDQRRNRRHHQLPRHHHNHRRN
ncbi:hypothetical protein CRE_02403 [Caenorhabditis remanei]|uniref:Uncharacterized protein n=1 Tax=Caenorhabditis remanei TaxID=31234 RepID=E3MIM5_CAERE|nr:hypothetical protein CRE_02403 [Caenorhabditis remanei]